jgi:uncharacterized repeat protein (TIGR03803 family)
MAGPIAIDAQGDIFGTTVNGGLYNAGMIWEVAADGSYSTLYNFCPVTDGDFCVDGAGPQGVTLDARGNLWGVAGNGIYGDGTLWEWTAGQLVVVHTFYQDGQNPASGLTFDAKGNLYGACKQGGAYGQGIVWEWTNGQLVTLFSFGGFPSDGWNPYTGPTLDKAGNLYGTTYYGGQHSGRENCCGIVYKLIAAQGYAEQILFTFSPLAGMDSTGMLILDPLENVYGTVAGGTKNDNGAIWRLAPTKSGTYAYANLSFGPLPDGESPQAGLVMVGADVYGTTYWGGMNDKGALFKAWAPGSKETLYSFCSEQDCADGQNPEAIAYFGGNFYGVAGNVLYEVTP